MRRSRMVGFRIAIVTTALAVSAVLRGPEEALTNGPYIAGCPSVVTAVCA